MVLISLVSLISLAVVLFLVVVKILISDYAIGSFTREEASSYECGFEQHSLSRIPLSVRYFLLTLVFLVFDLEVILLVFRPVDLGVGVSVSFVSIVSLMFIVLLFLGLVFEWYDGSLEWVIWVISLN